MKIQAPVVLFIAAAGFPFTCTAQTGTVTFYSYALTVKQQFASAAKPIGGKGSFTGWLYDGKQRMAHASRGRFMSFQLPAGEHDFSASYRSKQPGSTPLHLVIEAGKHYCVRLTAKILTPQIVPIVLLDGKIEAPSCTQAFEEAGKYRRIDLKRVDPAAQPELDNSLSFPREN